MKSFVTSLVTVALMFNEYTEAARLGITTSTVEPMPWDYTLDLDSILAMDEYDNINEFADKVVDEW